MKREHSKGLSISRVKNISIDDSLVPMGRKLDQAYT